MTIKVQYACTISLPFGIPTSKWLFPFPRFGMSHYITSSMMYDTYRVDEGKYESISIIINDMALVYVYRDVMCGKMKRGWTGMVGSQHNQAQHSNHVTRGLVPSLQSFRTFPCLVLSHKNKKPTWTCSMEWAQRDQIQRRHGPADVSCTKKRRRSGTLLEKVEKQSINPPLIF